ncbi:putative monovalent cation/H+ antiporter subunit B [Rubripirellula obstinata]|uniref:Putative monovalent cation/H+ antiporter subunit B n=1 Tax=Rubripirellula obstinata TaxID=406547 RepID=A0A5B1CRX0_9BACT|nr:MnhB domain-containing protein [Rubripirellula obstinata]KAA1262004.1 putative monovalent cation/H+ antiporter subunit B [Rubripirellula obstinata]
MSEVTYRFCSIVGLAVVVLVIVGVLGTAILSLPPEASGLQPLVDQSLDESGAKNPVTAVLLNFRGYDTMLELIVMLLAVIGARALTNGETWCQTKPDVEEMDPLLHGFVRLITPLMIVVAGYLLWVGGHEPGGAFQAAAVLAGVGVLLQLSGFPWFRHLSGFAERLLLVSGAAIFLLVGVGTMSAERAFLEYPVDAAKPLILLIETVATVSIATILLTLYNSGVLRFLEVKRQRSDGAGSRQVDVGDQS